MCYTVAALIFNFQLLQIPRSIIDANPKGPVIVNREAEAFVVIVDPFTIGRSPVPNSTDSLVLFDPSQKHFFDLVADLIPPRKMRVAVIGGGPSGLVTLKYLITAHNFHGGEPIEARLFESKESVAGTFRYRVYEDAELVSSKYLTPFSDFRLPASDADFVPVGTFVSVKRNASGGHVISISKGEDTEEWECDAVAVCSGLHVEPDIPHVKGIENVPVVMHSSQFKKRSDFGEGKNIMVLGAGETAHDISFLAVTSPTKSVTMCHRDGFFYAPKLLPVPIILSSINKSEKAQRNIPADTSIASLFDSAYVHPSLQKGSLMWTAYDQWAKRVFWLISGTSGGLDQWAGGISPERFHLSTILFVKSGKAIPYISAPYRSKSLFNTIRSKLINIPIKPTQNRTIDLAPWPESISPSGVVTFTPSTRPEAALLKDKVLKPDIIVFCTGYTISFPFLDSTYPTPLTADRRGIYSSTDPSVGFIGFVRPAIGAIPPLSELQAMHWVLSLLGHMRPSNELRDIDYKLRVHPGRRDYENYAVEHEAYAYQLALDMGVAASFTEVCGFGFKTAFTWAMGPNFNTKFRLVGPWKWDGANEIMRTELWNVVKKSGGWFFFATYTLIPFVIFGSMSGVLYAGSATADSLKRLGRLLQRPFKKGKKQKSI
ncbi:hypothetical protein G7Y89_g10896 [Cudoniella acicularis]|uniref:Flavin-containing monooxygenase n=1 Tax=Cudoniella acicularis TaxID=354080 RepID=A0A8H4RBV1_9HELO|nr:hypothetical protein G7Y89_g10896 [Cudoniella acicularis]